MTQQISRRHDLTISSTAVVNAARQKVSSPKPEPMIKMVQVALFKFERLEDAGAAYSMAPYGKLGATTGWSKLDVSELVLMQDPKLAETTSSALKAAGIDFKVTRPWMTADEIGLPSLLG